MNLKTIEDEWKCLEKAIFQGMEPPPSDTQVNEMRKSFYAGASVVLKVCSRIADEDIDEDVAIEWFEGRMDEMTDFVVCLMSDFNRQN